MKKASLLLALVLVAALLSGCGSPEQFSEATGVPQRDPLSTAPSATPDTGNALPDGYDPSSEEDAGGYVAGAIYDEYGQMIYAGASPIPLDPIDMPTATPRPSLTFSYGAVTADKLGLIFEAPAGWYVDSTASDMIVLTDPNSYDNFTATMTIKLAPVSVDYKLADVKTEVRNVLKELGKYNYITWETTELAARTLLKKDGYYANYRGEYYDGTVVRGRVMVALLDGNQILTVHMAAPGWYNESYMNVVAHFRDTLQKPQ